MRDLYQVIDTICLTEKAALLQEKNNQHVFKVARDANKLEVKRAVETFFGVKVAKVRTCNCPGKNKRRRRPDAGRTARWKKAYVTLKAGETLELA